MPYRHRFEPRRSVIKTLVDAKFDNVSVAARTMGLTPPALHDILRGRRKGREETLRAIADYLGVPFFDIVDRVDDEVAA